MNMGIVTNLKQVHIGDTFGKYEVNGLSVSRIEKIAKVNEKVVRYKYIGLAIETLVFVTNEDRIMCADIQVDCNDSGIVSVNVDDLTEITSEHNIESKCESWLLDILKYCQNKQSKKMLYSPFTVIEISLDYIITMEKFNDYISRFKIKIIPGTKYKNISLVGIFEEGEIKYVFNYDFGRYGIFKSVIAVTKDDEHYTIVVKHNSKKIIISKDSKIVWERGLIV